VVNRLWSCALPTPPLPAPRVWTQIVRIWARMCGSPSHAGPILAEELRHTRTLGSKERRVAGDVLTGLIRHERALARLAPEPLVAWERLCTEGVPDLDDPDNAYAIAVSLPDALGAEWQARLGDRAVGVAQALAGRAPMFLRILREPWALPVPTTRLGPHTLRVEAGVNLDTVPSYREGALEVQDLGSQRIVDAAFPGPGATVLDLCAGAGGKSLSLAALGARVTAWDIRPQALRTLAERACRAGLDIRVAAPEGRYDVVLVDAPCSGTGVLRRHPENRWKLRAPTDTQAALLAQARTLGGRVVYATCALNRAENEAIAGEGTTLWPEADGHDGFFFATLPGR
jgi:16S rRNA (cytosine967-C5)-methyltransferase